MSLADQQWCLTSVQVTVQQARGLRVKGKSGTNDAYAVMQVGKEKSQTSVVEKSVAPVWREEAAFDPPPLPLLLHQDGGGGKEHGTLHVHVLHRALVGLDKQLGQAVVNLLQLSEDKTRNKTE
ncbi:rab11 family-interacting protein 2-like [Cebidichthys violaceus]|uniref:rab11 family-interacting protein 2-like n=1 Tax=Cebidichthys violaceus TaxID=271503 RepID=UPI0035CC7B79